MQHHRAMVNYTSPFLNFKIVFNEVTKLQSRVAKVLNQSWE